MTTTAEPKLQPCWMEMPTPQGKWVISLTRQTSDGVWMTASLDGEHQVSTVIDNKATPGMWVPADYLRGFVEGAFPEWFDRLRVENA